MAGEWYPEKEWTPGGTWSWEPFDFAAKTPPVASQDAIPGTDSPAAVVAALWAIAEAAREVVMVGGTSSFPQIPTGNAPGHLHKRPPFWDDLGGDQCQWCVVWQALVDALEAGRETNRQENPTMTNPNQRLES